MDTQRKSIFRQMLMEEYQKRPKNVDVVAIKRKKFKTLLTVAHESLRKKNFSEAKQNYFDILEYLRNEPYPDELDLPSDTEFGLKCFFCYSSLMDTNFCENTDTNSFTKRLTNLVEEYGNRLFPKYLYALFYFQKRNWVMSLYWCNAVEDHTEEEESYYKCIKSFEELLPGPSDIKTHIDIWQEKSFYGCGQELTKKNVMKPRIEKYLLWLKELENSTANGLLSLKEPLSLIDLHRLFHQHIYPLWCESNSGIEVNLYYDENYLPHCEECTRAKAYSPISNNGQNTQISFYRSVKEFVDLYKTFITNENFTEVTELSVLDNISRIRRQAEELEQALINKKADVNTQTDRIKRVQKCMQTEDNKYRNKTRSIEVQANSDPPILSAVLDMKNKMLVNLEKKDITISKLSRTVLELTEKLNKARSEHSKKILTEVESQRDMVRKCKEDLKLQVAKNVLLQKSFMDQFHQTFNAYKQIYKTFKEKSLLMLTSLREIGTYLISNSIVSETDCKQNIHIWNNHLTNVNEDLNCLNVFYKTSRSDMINLEKFTLIWPDLPKYPKEDDNIIFINLIPALRNIIKKQQIKKPVFTTASLANDVQPSFLSDDVSLVEANVDCPDVLQQSLKKTSSGSICKKAHTLQVQSQPLRIQKMRDLVKVKKTGEFKEQFIKKTIKSNELDTLPHHSQEIPVKQMYKINQEWKISESIMYIPTSNAAPEADSVSSQTLGTNNDGQETEKVLFHYVFENCPFNTEEEVTLALLQVVDDNKGSLSHLPLERILEDVKGILRMKRPTAWVVPKSPHVDWQNDHTESTCAICFEEFALNETYTLQCQHKYHKECIKTWLKNKSVCPICRIYSVIDEEFPPLTR